MCDVQEAADAAAKVRAAEIQERPAVRARSSSPEDAAGTTGRAGTAASVEDDAQPGTASVASRNGSSQGPYSDDGSHSGEDASLSTGESSGDVTSEEEEPAVAPSPGPGQASRKQPQPARPVERQGSSGPIRGHVEYLQVGIPTRPVLLLLQTPALHVVVLSTSGLGCFCGRIVLAKYLDWNNYMLSQQLALAMPGMVMSLQSLTRRLGCAGAAGGKHKCAGSAACGAGRGKTWVDSNAEGAGGPHTGAERAHPGGRLPARRPHRAAPEGSFLWVRFHPQRRSCFKNVQYIIPCHTN